MSPKLPLWGALVVGSGLFLGIYWLFYGVGLPLWGDDSFLPPSSLGSHFVFKAVLFAASLVLMAMDRRPWRAFGWQRPAAMKWHWVWASGLGLGALTTLLILITPAQGHPLLKAAGLGEIILVIWIWSSLTEEVFTRGLLQTWTRVGSSSSLVSRPILASALVFGAMHLSLLSIGTDGWTVAIIVTATTALGLLAGIHRQSSDSLLPAILVHVAFNVGGLMAGIFWTLSQGNLNSDVL
ncbi:MAG: CPBP family intramembrane metalloprotease [Deltaproteobacteria bacterium]|nr:CPBP family intramembrane metalloprotease [Deltaproteobacteria bacterium]